MALTLTELETAITAIQTQGQSVSFDGVTYTAANLGSLIDLRRDMLAESERTSRARPLFRGFNLSGMGYSGDS